MRMNSKEEAAIIKRVDYIIETWDLTPTQKLCLHLIARTIYLEGFTVGINEAKEVIEDIEK